jgi:hypothetical protein
VVSAVAIAALLGVSGSVARARDGGGIIQFFQQQLGGGGESSAPPPPPSDWVPTARLPQPSYADAPNLTVRMRPRRHASRPSRSPKETLVALKDVTIYNDKTLERGDAVMTQRGMRIFNGSSTWPYTDADFVALSATKVAPEIRKQLSAMDVASRVDAVR